MRIPLQASSIVTRSGPKPPQHPRKSRSARLAFHKPTPTTTATLPSGRRFYQAYRWCVDGISIQDRGVYGVRQPPDRDVCSVHCRYPTPEGAEGKRALLDTNNEFLEAEPHSLEPSENGKKECLKGKLSLVRGRDCRSPRLRVLQSRHPKGIRRLLFRPYRCHAGSDTDFFAVDVSPTPSQRPRRGCKNGNLDGNVTAGHLAVSAWPRLGPRHRDPQAAGPAPYTSAGSSPSRRAGTVPGQCLGTLYYHRDN